MANVLNPKMHDIWDSLNLWGKNKQKQNITDMNHPFSNWITIEFQQSIWVNEIWSFSHRKKHNSVRHVERMTRSNNPSGWRNFWRTKVYRHGSIPLSYEPIKTLESPSRKEKSVVALILVGMGVFAQSCVKTLRQVQCPGTLLTVEKFLVGETSKHLIIQSQIVIKSKLVSE